MHRARQHVNLLNQAILIYHPHNNRLSPEQISDGMLNCIGLVLLHDHRIQTMKRSSQVVHLFFTPQSSKV